MNTAKLKSFAPACRIALIKQVGVKLDYVLTAKTPDLAEKENLLNELRRAMKSEGREALIERVAYTWFNRFAAFRYLDARNWHPFKKRLITSAKAEEVLPELLQQVCIGVLPEELKPFVPMDRVNNLLDRKLASANPQAEVQRLLVIGVSQYYADLQPGLFNKIDAFTELLLPDDLLTEHSVVHGFATDISDDDCSEVEILGWLYQFYISEKKDAVMARKKAVPSEDIPAVTQLFTPHWIVRYLVENSLGRLWLRSRPHSRLKEHMPYYVEDPEGQTPTDSLTVAKPEEIKLLDPACGSGHMLTYAFDLLVKIYEEEGHAPSEIPEKILTHNLFGLEICPRAAQLAQFALVCKAREQSRAAFRRPVQPQVVCLQNVVLTPEDMQSWSAATGVKLSQDELAQIHQFRENTETFGALIQPVLDGEKLAALVAKIGEQAPAGDLLVQNTHRKLRLVLDQAEMLSQRYQVVVANPPYMGGKQMTPLIKDVAKNRFPDSKGDLFAMFIERGFTLSVPSGWSAMVTMQSWMFLSSYAGLREKMLRERTIHALVHMANMVMGIAFGTAATVWENRFRKSHAGHYSFVSFGDLDDENEPTTFPIQNQRLSRAASENFHKISGSPIAYWSSDAVLSAFQNSVDLETKFMPRQGMATTNNDLFLRLWVEIPYRKGNFQATSARAALESGAKWFPYNKGGGFRKWYGNAEYVVNYENDGTTICDYIDNTPGVKVKSNGRVINRSKYFKPSVTWSKVSSGSAAFRCLPDGFVFDVAGTSIFADSESALLRLAGLLNSHVIRELLTFLAPTLNFEVGQICKIPLIRGWIEVPCIVQVEGLVALSHSDWDNFETSWDFRDLPLLRSGEWEVEPGQPGGTWKGRTLAESWDHYAAYCTAAIRRMQELETENNRLWIDAYGLQDELTPEVPEDEITLARADAKKDVAAFLSYAVGCMMGRYSLDHPGLILANAGDTVENYLSKVGKPLDEIQFLPDDDAIIPITEDEWFEDDAASRVREFLKVTFGTQTLDENLGFIKQSLGRDLRKYFTANAGGFYADHVQTYKKRPIYWMFESPKKHFRALVYLHRYTKDTVNTLLNGYLREFRHKLTHRRDQLEGMVAGGSATTADRKALKTTLEAIKDVETYEREILLPLAHQRLEIDLDDGVKVNYPKFGKALAKITGLS